MGVVSAFQLGDPKRIDAIDRGVGNEQVGVRDVDAQPLRVLVSKAGRDPQPVIVGDTRRPVMGARYRRLVQGYAGRKTPFYQLHWNGFHGYTMYIYWPNRYGSRGWIRGANASSA